MSEKKLFLLDGHALVYRAHYSFIHRPLINSKGINTSAPTGFVRTLWDMMRNQSPTHLAVAFDLPTPTFRHTMYEPYKANRDAQPEDITIAMPYIKEIVEAFKIPVVTAEGYEADDVIGTLAKQAEKEGFKVYMVTPDKDYAQLVSENIFMYKPSRKGTGIDILGVPEVLEKWQIKRVDQVIDVLGLQGDSVDNIPGVPGIGAKTAVKLLDKFDSVEGLLANTDQLRGKQKEKVIEFSDQARLSKTLATIDINVPIQFDAKKYEVEPFDRDRLANVFRELEFRTLAKQILGEDETVASAASIAKGQQTDLFGNATAAPKKAATRKAPAAHSVASKNISNTTHQYHLVDTKEKRAELIELLSQQKSICFDTETTGIDANEAEMVGMSFAIKPGEAWYVPVPANQDEARAIIHEFKSLMENENIEKVAQNIKYDAIMFRWYGVEVKGKYLDTMVAHYLLEPSLRHGMDYLAETYLEYQPISIETLIGKRGKNQLTMRDLRPEKIVDYASEDADITLQLKEYLFPKLKEEGLQELYDNMEEPLIKVLVDLEYEGVNLNAGYLEAYSKVLEKQLLELEQAIYKEAGEHFNINSPRQVGNILFVKMKIPYRWRKTKTGQYSTNEAKLTELALKYPFVNKIMEYRGLAKLKSTYVDALPPMVNSKTGRIHSSFNQALAATGRLSSNNPNLQNIPIRTEQGRKVREAFIPRDDKHILLAADYSQIELRIIAEISKDKNMITAFQAGQDIHRATAAGVFDVPYDKVTREQRYRAKTVNFSIVYGAGSTNLSQQLDIPRKEAKKIIDQYFKEYSGLKDYMEKTVEFCRENGYVTTLMGRRRYIRDIDSRNNLARSNAERVSINTPIQGTAADMIKMAMVKMKKALKDGGFKTKMIIQVHDELVFDVPKEELERVKPVIEENMRTAITGLQVPIVVSMDTGEHWLDAH